MSWLANRCIRIGLALVVFGWGPLIDIVLLDAVGLWPDKNPNPVGAGFLFFITSWPALFLLVRGWLQLRTGRDADR